MKDSLDELAREVVARHLGVAAGSIDSDQRLGFDLRLTPLDRVVIARRLEELEGIEFPLALLELAETVGDLANIVRAVHARAFRAGAAATERRESGVDVRERATGGAVRATSRAG